MVSLYTSQVSFCPSYTPPFPSTVCNDEKIHIPKATAGDG